MLRRNFLGSLASGAAVATVLHVNRLLAEPPPSDNTASAVSVLMEARHREISGDFEGFHRSFHSDAVRVEPGSLEPVVGRAAISNRVKEKTRPQRLLYFYYRQPQVHTVGNSALVISNYEAGYEEGGQTIEENGKTSNVVLLGPTQPLIALEVIVPNLSAGGYGALGTPLKPHFGIFPLRALGEGAGAASPNAGGGENDVLYSQVRAINNAWVTGNADDLLKHGDKSAVFLIGDYSPFYITGTEAIKQHFADFYKTSKVNFIRERDPVVKIWGSVAAVYFNFDLDYSLGGQRRHSPGRAVYTFSQRGAPGVPWAMAACAASHVVARNIGDPYPTTA